MPLYRLRRISDQEVIEDDARDAQHALVVFGQRLGVTLTLEVGDAGPAFMMGRIEKKEPHWAKPEDIPVYEVTSAPTS